MKLPSSVVRSFQDIQRNFDFLSSRVLGTSDRHLQVSERRITSDTCPAGGDHPVGISTAGFSIVYGVIVVHTAPVTHWTFRWFPRVSDIVVQNNGVTQIITFHYYVIGVKS